MNAFTIAFSFTILLLVAGVGSVNFNDANNDCACLYNKSEFLIEVFGDAYTLQCRNCSLRNFTKDDLPANITELLGQLNLSNSGIEYIDDNSLQNLTSMLAFRASHNNLTRISASLFVNLRLLTMIDLSNNNIKEIEPFAFSGPNLLYDLNLSYNKIAALQKDSFSDIALVTKLDLSHNQLSTFATYNWRQLNPPHLNWDARLKLNHNLIQHFGCIEIASFNNFRTIDLSSNKLESIDLNCTIDRLHNEFELMLNDNELQSLELPTSTFVADLSAVFASKNKITAIVTENTNSSNPRTWKDRWNIPDRIDTLNVYPKLKILDLSYNKITGIGPHTFFDFLRLEIWNFTHNSITSLPSDLISTSFVKELDFSYNQIDEIPKLNGTRYYNMPDRLILSNNHIQHLRCEDLEAMRYIRMIELSANPIESLAIGCDIKNETYFRYKLSHLTVGVKKLNFGNHSEWDVA